MKTCPPTLWLIPLVLIIPTPLPAEEPDSRTVVSKAVRYLEEDMVRWREQRHCAACHHGPLYVWSLNVARRAGFAVDEPRLREMTEWLVRSDDARVFPRAESVARLATSSSPADRMTAQMMGRKNLSQPTLFLTHALNSLSPDEPLRKVAWERVASHLAESQLDDGSFAGPVGRPPIFNTPQILTLWAATGLQGAQRPLGPALDPVRARATAWLAKQPADETQQGLVLRLLWESADATSPTESQRRLIQRLRTLQRASGGWGQTDELTEDAFATGQALYALKRAGVPANDPALRNAASFLARTQRNDGTWPMVSRPHPENGTAASNLNPITYAAVAWAVLGLTS